MWCRFMRGLSKLFDGKTLNVKKNPSYSQRSTLGRGACTAFKRKFVSTSACRACVPKKSNRPLRSGQKVSRHRKLGQEPFFHQPHRGRFETVACFCKKAVIQRSHCSERIFVVQRAKYENVFYGLAGVAALAYRRPYPIAQAPFCERGSFSNLFFQT